MILKRRQPRIFVGSSTEGLSVAYALQEALDYDAEVTVWNQGLFRPSDLVLSKLLASLNDFDFAIFVFTADDLSEIRGQKYSTARDNVIFELGLFLGRLGLDRCFFIAPRHTKDLHLPTDLLGIVPLTYNNERSDGLLVAAVGAACNQIRAAMRLLGADLQEPRRAAGTDGGIFTQVTLDDYIRIWDNDLNASRTRIRNIDSDPRSEEFQAALTDVAKVYAFLESLSDRILAQAVDEIAARQKFREAVLSFWPFYGLSVVPPGSADADDYWRELPKLGLLYARWK
ncbi:nucleotide-binding protein [Rhizobium sp. BR 249]|uniref:nucleotide-binding protein n=1 Tax=Rhizobium sp. BR 249 TaxID=3040011 RepID=UPI0039BFECDD